MIDEKKLIESFRASLITGRESFPVDLIVECIENQPKLIERFNCENCSRRNFYQQGYEAGLKENRWIPCSERLPKSEDVVEITYTTQDYETGETMYFTARAFYEDGTVDTEDSYYCWWDLGKRKYDKEKDAYIIPEGWWESVRFSENFVAIDKPVIAWMPLPEPYREGDKND